MNQFRIETDFLGSKEVPKDAYYGVQTMRGAENFPLTGQVIPKSLIEGLAVVKKAAALANKDAGFMHAEIADAIAAASDEILAGNYHDQFICDPIQGGAGTSINMNANEVIANIALEKMGKNKGDYATISPNTHVNMAQSTNDAFPSAAHVAIAQLLVDLQAAMSKLHAGLLLKSKEFDGLIKMGRTHLQDAVPIRLGQEFGAYAAALARSMENIKGCMPLATGVNMGATAVGTGLNADKGYIEKVIQYMREFTGMDITLVDNLIDGTQNTDGYVYISGCLKACMSAMSKMANDLRLMASGPRAGLFEIVLPGRQPGSSIMPGKVNPVMAEVMSQVAFQVIGNDVTITMASEAGQFELNVMEPVLFYNLLQSLQIMTNVFHSFHDFCLVGIKANPEVMQAYVEKSVGTVTAINPHVGYEVSSKIAKKALETGRPVRELVLEAGVLTEEELAIIMDPFEMTEIGIPGKELLK